MSGAIFVALSLGFFSGEYTPQAHAQTAGNGAASQGEESPYGSPTVYSVTINNAITEDIEVIVWKDGALSFPVKRIARLLDLSPQESPDTRMLFYSDPHLKATVELNWENGTVRLGEQVLQPDPSHPLIRNENGFLEPTDVYADARLVESLFHVTLRVDPQESSIALQTDRALISLRESTTLANVDEESRYFTVAHPEIINRPVERIYITGNSFSNLQRVEQGIPASVGGGTLSYDTDTVSNIVTTGVQGTLFGKIDYYVKPSFIRFNGDTNFQNIDWLFRRNGRRLDWRLGSFDAGLSPLVSPSLPVWGFSVATKNATTPQIATLPYRNYAPARTASGTQLELKVNDQSIEKIPAGQQSTEFEPVYLQLRQNNVIEVVERGADNETRVLLKETIPYFQNILRKRETAMSAFAGRNPVQFQPLLDNPQGEKNPVFMPQSEKWLAGGRIFHGVTDRLTVGVSGAASTIFGRPETFFLNPNPFTQDLTGFVSYQRDPNFFQGQTLGISGRYQLTRNLQLFGDGAGSVYQLKPGSYLSGIPDRETDKAGRAGVIFQTSRFNAQADAFHYGTYFYSPDSIYNNYLYDRQGVGAGISGALPHFMNLNYRLRWDHYRTNLDDILTGGPINADSFRAYTRFNLTPSTAIGFNMDWTEGRNREQTLTQRFGDLTLEQGLPRGLSARVRLSHQLTNYVLLPRGQVSTRALYENNGIDTSLFIPFDRAQKNSLLAGHVVSSFVDYFYARARLQYKRVFTELSVQKSYGGREQIIDSLGCRLGYEFASGRRLSVGYQIFRNDIRLAGLPDTRVRSHQFFFDFADILGIVGGRLRSIGAQGDAMASVSGSLFVDLNHNGRMDANEMGAPGINLVLDNREVITTDAKGRYLAPQLDGGAHTLELEAETLPVYLDAERLAYRVKVLPGKNHRLDIALQAEGGRLSGVVNVRDIEGAKLEDGGVLLVLTDEQGRTLNYTTADKQGNYSFANLAPGKYRVDVEPRLKASGRYRLLKSPPPFEIPAPRTMDGVIHLSVPDTELLKAD